MVDLRGLRGSFGEFLLPPHVNFNLLSKASSFPDHFSEGEFGGEDVTQLKLLLSHQFVTKTIWFDQRTHTKILTPKKRYLCIVYLKIFQQVE